MEQQHKRICYLDLMKSIAIISVVFYHSSGNRQVLYLLFSAGVNSHCDTAVFFREWFFII